jgi:hypothetical protein
MRHLIQSKARYFYVVWRINSGINYRSVEALFFAASDSPKNAIQGGQLEHRHTPFQKYFHRLSTGQIVHTWFLLNSLKNRLNVPNILKSINNIFFNFPLLCVDNSPVQEYYAPTRLAKKPG